MAAHEASRGGELRLDVSLHYVNQDQPRLGRRKAAVGELSNGEHDEISTVNRIWNLRADYDSSSRWGLGIELPVVDRSHDHIAHEPSGDEARHWSFSGVGDLRLELRWLAVERETPASPGLTFSAAGKFPTGRTGARDSEGNPAEITLQPGSGSYDFIGGVSYAQSPLRVRMLDGSRAPWAVFSSLTYRVNGPGSRGYRIGDELQANLGSSYPLWSRLDLLTQANLKARGMDDRGGTDEDVSFTGGTFLYISPGLRWHLSPGLSVYAYAQLPVYQRVNQEQITAESPLLVGATYRFGAVR